MPKTKISEFSSTPANNTDIDSINIAEGCAPSGINDAIRELMAQLKDFQVGSAGDPVTVGGVLTVQAGSASTPALTTAGDTNTGMFFPAADTIAFAEGGAEVARFDSGGNLGLGVTPSAWATLKALQVGNGAAIASAYNSTYIYANAFFNGSNSIYLSTNRAVSYTMDAVNGYHAWNIAPSGTAGNAITFTQAATLTAAGDFLVGATSSTWSTSGRGVIEVNGSSSAIIGLKTGNTARGYIYTQGTDLIVSSSGGACSLQTDAATPVIFGTNNTERARIDSSGNLLVGTTTANGRLTVVGGTTAGTSAQAGFGGTNATSFRIFHADRGGSNAALCVAKLEAVDSTARSINAAGTVNASGADYAEYMTKAGDFTVAKGDVVGINAQGKLTNVFANAVSFVVKSTNPSYVGGDTWGNEDAIGLRPDEPKQFAATENTEAETDEAFAIRYAQYESDKATFDAALEAARALVDRIAFSGQVPVNVTGATSGQYIIPVNDNGSIKGQAVSNPTFEQYQSAVGKVIAIEADGRARIIVKVV